jgi:hypothetical protein
MRKFPFFIGIILVSLIPLGIVQAAGEGWILNVIGTGGQQTGQPVNITSEIMAVQKITTSNLYYTIIAQSNNQIVATHSTNVPTLNPNQHFNDAWSTSTAGWPAPGMYTITLCWSTGSGHSCNIHSQTTQIWAVPTLGWALGLIGLMLVLYWAWRRRSVFEQAFARGAG